MTAPDEKARQEAEKLTADWWADAGDPGDLSLEDRITAALIEARRAALEDAAITAGACPCRKYGEFDNVLLANEVSVDIAAAIRALIPTRPDGAAEGEQ